MAARIGWGRAFGLVLAAWVSGAAASAWAADTWSNPHPGVALLERTTATPWRIFALRVDLCARGVSVRATTEAEKQHTTGWFRSNTGVQAAVNGDFFSYTDYFPIGLAIGEGSLWHADNATLGYAAFGPDRSLISPPTEVLASAEGWMRQAVGGFPLLVENGVALESFSPAPDHCPDRHPRTALGLSRDRRTLWMVVVDGRTSGAAGMTCRELAVLMAELGAWRAINLDGGGSSTMVVEGRGVVNVPSGGSERVVSNHLGVFASGSGAPGACDLWMAEVIVDAGVLDDGGTTDLDGDGRADLCARAAAGLRCYPSTGSGFAGAWTLEELSDAAGWNDESNYATLRFGDIDGDGRADVCARGDARVACWPSTGSGFGPRIDGPALADADGWNRPEYYSTLRLADADGDGRDDLCARDAGGWRCWPSTGTGFGDPMLGPDWSDAWGWNQPWHYGTFRTGDLNGDGRADVCARGAAGMFCALSDGTGFPTRLTGPDWSNDAGFTDVKYWSGIRMVDLDGDGRDDLCARTPDGIDCRRSLGDGFGPRIAGPALTDASGWGDLDNAATLRFADLDADGDADLCARANAGLRCWPWTGDGFGAGFDGPAWDDASGWDDFRLYATFHLADLDGDRRADACGRSADGIRCALSTGTGFGPLLEGPALADSVGWAALPYASTVRFAGPRPPRCVPTTEVCDGVDNDCDDEIDEGCAAEDGGTDAAVDGDGGGGDAPGEATDGGGEDGTAVDDGGGEGDGGADVTGDAGDGSWPGGWREEGGCGCRAAGEGRGPAGSGLGAVVVLLASWAAVLRRRRWPRGRRRVG